MKSKFVDPYKILGVSKKASAADIKEAFRNYVKKNTVRGAPVNSEEFIRVKDARERLIDPKERERVDAILQRRRLRRRLRKEAAQAAQRRASSPPPHSPPPVPEAKQLLFRQGYQTAIQHMKQQQQAETDRFLTALGFIGILAIGAHLLDRN